VTHDDHETPAAPNASPVIAWDAPPSRTGRGTRTSAWLAVAIGFGGLVALALTEGLIGGGGAGVPLDTATDGVGLAGGTAVPPIVTMAFAVIAAIGLATMIRRGPNVDRAAAIVGIAVLAFGVASMTERRFVAEDATARLWGDGIGHTTSSPPGIPTWSEYDVGPGEPATFAFAIRNDGLLPVSILGYAHGPTRDLGFDIVGLGSLPASEVNRADGRPPQMAAAIVAWPIRLEPGEQLLLVAVGRGGPCAAGVQADQAESATLISRVRLAYRLAGWTREVEVGLPTIVTVPTNPTTCEIPPDA
jgi:hypothetical protein